jgi:IS30 family transposase
MLIAFSPARDATMKTYKQLTYELRCQIYALNRTGMSQNKIAQQLNVSQSTISRELFRNTGKRGYRIKQAQTATDTRRLAACKAIKMTTSLIAVIESKIHDKWSPEQVSGWLREEHSIASAMKPFISTFGRTSDVVATYSSVYKEKGRLINHAVKINKLVEGLLRTVSVLMSDYRLLMTRVE